MMVEKIRLAHNLIPIADRTRHAILAHEYEDATTTTCMRTNAYPKTVFSHKNATHGRTFTELEERTSENESVVQSFLHFYAF